MTETTFDEEFQGLKEVLTILLAHLRDHADFRGRIKQLDKGCPICQNYFADELAKL